MAELVIITHKSAPATLQLYWGITGMKCQSDFRLIPVLPQFYFSQVPVKFQHNWHLIPVAVITTIGESVQ